MVSTGFSLYNLAFYFIIYAFVGWCLEVAFSFLETGGFVNRGFLNGPICPIYGFGGTIVIVCLTPLADNLLLLFLGSIVLTSILELITGIMLEKIFHRKWWDYSEKPFNINGYICLEFSVIWGIMCVILVKAIHPVILGSIRLLPLSQGYIILGIVYITILVDIIITITTILRLKNIMKDIFVVVNKLKEKLGRIGETISEEVLDLKDKYTKLIEDNSIKKSRIFKAFPDLQNIVKEIKKEFKKEVSNKIRIKK
jgi:uncharacterized membrane protein